MITNSNDHYLSFGELLHEAEEERMTFTPDKMLTFWIPILDKHTLGIFPHDLVVIGADTWVWKSELAYIISVANAKRNKKGLLFALEGNINEIARRYTQRMIAESGEKISNTKFRVNTDIEVHHLAKAVMDVATSEWRTENLRIFNKSEAPTIEFIVEMIKVSMDFFDFYVIDHLHYIEYSDKNSENVEISKAMRILQTTTGEVKKPIILVWHLRKRNGSEDPTKYDLHGSSNIPKEATTILLITKMDKFENSKFSYKYAWQVPSTTNRYSGTKMILDKSRAWMPPVKISMIYDLKEKRYLHEFDEVISDWGGFVDFTE